MSEFTTRIIKGGALLNDSRRFLEYWEPDLSADENLARLQEANILQKRSRSRSEDALAVLRQRFASVGEDALSALKLLARQDRPFVDACLFEAARNDDLLAHAAGEILFGWRSRREFIVTPDLLESELRRGPSGTVVETWSAPTLRRVSHGLLATLRDFGLLEGKAVKRIGRPRLSLPGFSYALGRLAMLEQNTPRVVGSPAWRWWFLDERDVRALLLEADREGLIRYAEAGSVLRIDWCSETLEETVRAAA